MTRLRLRFTKLGRVRFISHRDVARLWERALRRAGLAVAYSGGYVPRPRLSFGLALSTGHESLAEYLDVDLGDDGVDPSSLAERLNPALPGGIDVTAAATVQPGEVSLQEAVTSCSWRIEACSPHPAVVPAAVERALAAGSLVVTRQRKGRDVTDDLRPAITHLAVLDVTPAGAELDAELAVHPRSVRPAELLDALAAAGGVALEEGRVRRTHQWISRDGAKVEPLALQPPLAATSPPHAGARA